MEKFNAVRYKEFFVKHKISFARAIVIFLAAFFLARLPATIYVTYFQYEDVFGFALGAFICTGILTAFYKKLLPAYGIFVFLYLLPAYLKLQTKSPVNINELTDTFSFAVLLFSLWIILWLLTGKIKSRFVRKGMQVILGAGFSLSVLLPLVIIGYYVVSGCILTTSIILTLFQTNLGEAAGYLRNQNALLWGGALIGLMAFIIFYLIQVLHITKKCTLQWHSLSLCILLVLFGICEYKGIYKSDNTMVRSLIKQTTQSLEQYAAYRKAKHNRLQNLSKLHNISLDPRKSGLFVLVIGESENRDHMQAFGYERDTTPWLAALAKQKGTILFPHAYSNHTHTVPTLTYALTGKNQYNDMQLVDAYSILEVAKSAGYKTYWISNQVKYGAYDTPVASIASGADKEIWINGNSGDTTWTTDFDGKLVEKLQQVDYQQARNMLIVVHLMGSHADYQERYPKEQEKYSVEKKDERRINAYDNTVAYTDTVLAQIYHVASTQPNFRGMIYMSDHGEDMEYSHEATKFTWAMTHIPFFIALSPMYQKDNPQISRALWQHRNTYWTNDLLYEVMVDLLGIRNVPGYSQKTDIASEQFNMPLQELRTKHGKNRIQDDPAVLQTER